MACIHGLWKGGSSVDLREVAGMGMPAAPVLAGAQRSVPGTLAQWAESLSRSRAGRRGGVLRFAFYGRVSTED